MAHTNSTPNYALPQFIPTDKPAWLTDINVAFSSIDTGIDNAKDAADAAQNDATQAISDAASATSTANTADAKAGGAVASISENFEPTNTYNVGDLVMYNNLLYTCTTAVTVPGPWTGNTNWTRTSCDQLFAIEDAKILNLNGTTLVNDPIDPTTSISDAIALKADASDVNSYAVEDCTNAMLNAFPAIDSSGSICEVITKGNISIINIRFKCSSSITSGAATLPISVAAPREIRGSISSLDNKGGFIQINSKQLLIRCAASPDNYLAGQVVFPNL